MPYTPDAACMAAARAAAGDDLSEDEVRAAFQRVSDHRDALIRSGQSVGLEARLRRFAADEARKTATLAAINRANAARNIVVHDKLKEQIQGFIKAGIRPRDALLAVLEGTQRGVTNARRSIAATYDAIKADYLGSLFSELQREAPHILPLLHDEKLDADTLAEMVELKPNGNPGVTGNKDAVFLAKTFAKYAELGRVEHNRLGGMMGKLDGWNGVQMHDDFKMIAGLDSREKWIGYIVTKLDLERTFPDGLTDVEVHDALGSMFDTITTGVPATPTSAEMGKRVGPSGLAKSFAASRVLHFKDAAAALDYRDRYGYSNTVAGMISHLNRMAKVNANMTVLGPNPEVMFNAAAAETARYVREAKEVPAGVKYGLPGKRHVPTLEEWKHHEAGLINTQAGVLRQGMDIATGLASRPVDTTMATIGANIRATQSMAKLGAALPSSLADVPTAAAAGMFRGSGFFKTLMAQLAGIRDFSANTNDFKEQSYLLGEGFDGLIGHINAAMAGQDRTPGIAAIAMEKFFKWNGLTWWTDAGRASAAHTVASEMGMRSGSLYEDLPPAYRHVLGLNGIDSTRWDIMRQGTLASANGHPYLTPDRIHALPDTAFVGMAADRIKAARKASRVDEAVSATVRASREANFQERRTAIINDARRDVVLSMRRFVTDETSYGVIKTDARTQRSMTWGMRPGTKGGEAIRFLMQFKGFPIAFGERVLGRAIYGARADAKVGERAAHIGTLIAGLGIAGYMAMTMKDMLKGYWPPRNPADPRTVLAALQQGGAIGIYGDYLFGSSNRFGGTLLETLAGPTLGSVSQILDVAMDARDAATSGGEDKFSTSRAFSTALGQTPFANLHLLKPAMDYLFLNSLREMLSPGYLRKQDKDREKQYGQSRLWPDTMQGGGG